MSEGRKRALNVLTAYEEELQELRQAVNDLPDELFDLAVSPYSICLGSDTIFIDVPANEEMFAFAVEMTYRINVFCSHCGTDEDQYAVIAAWRKAAVERCRESDAREAVIWAEREDWRSIESGIKGYVECLLDTESQLETYRWFVASKPPVLEIQRLDGSRFSAKLLDGRTATFSIAVELEELM